MQSKSIRIAAALALFAIVLIGTVHGTPNGVTIIPISNSTGGSTSAGIVNISGGSIATVNLNGSSQNLRWKAFVGNATGLLTLDDASGNAIYDWSITTIEGEVYATRQSGTINWTGIGCASANVTELENINISHTNPDDNITATFRLSTHPEFTIGTSQIASNTCRSLYTYVNSTTQSTSFSEIILH